MVLPALYYLFGRTYAAFGMKDASADTLKPLFGYNSANVKHAQMAMQHYGLDGIEKIILLMNEYNLKSLGVGDQGTPGTALLKEAVTKMILD
jgi:DNA polymerase-3 subunit delta